MKKVLLSAFALCAAMSVSAQTTVLFEDDFEWLAPWTAYVDAKGNSVGDAIGTDNEGTYAPQIPTAWVLDGQLVEKDTEGAKNVLMVLEEKGYKVIRENLGKENPGECIYTQVNYLKFGKKDFQAGIILPAMETSVTDVTYSFDWAPQRAGKNAYDPTQLIVIVSNPGAEDMIFDVPAHTQESGAPLKWFHADIALTGATVNEKTTITLRPGANDWSKSGQHRFYLDNIKVTGKAEGSAVENIAVEENAPAEYFNLQGVRVANPENGLYIVRKGSKVSKVLVK